MNSLLTVHEGDCLQSLRLIPSDSVQCCVTSPPYWGLRDYGVTGQIGLEPTLGEFINRLVNVFQEVRRVLRKDGVCWVNMGDCYAADRGGTHQPAETLAGGVSGRMADGSIVNRGRSVSENPTRNARIHGFKHKDLIGQPWRLAFALQSDGWWLRKDIIWHKPNPMPESVQDRCTKSHEYVFMLTKSDRYYWDTESAKERVAGGERNRRSVWTINTSTYSGAHFATFPTEIPRRCILASTRPGDTVLDPFGGSGTTAMVAMELGRIAILCELNPEYAEMARNRCNVTPGLHLA